MADKELTEEAVLDVVNAMLEEGIAFSTSVVRNPEADTGAAVKDKSRLGWRLRITPFGSKSSLSTIWGYCSTEHKALRLGNVAMVRMAETMGGVSRV